MEGMKMETTQADQGKACAALSYILIGVIWYFVDENMKKNTFAKFHAKQGIVLMIAWIAWSVAVSILMVPLFFLFFVAWLLYLVPWVFVVLGILNAVNGKETELPVIGSFASKLAF
jgi:uncharacterized membrane protein